MKITYQNASRMLQACAAIEPALTGEGSGTSRIRLAYNMKKLRDAEELAQETRNKVFKEIVGEGVASIPNSDPRAAVLGMRIQEIDQTETEIKLWKIDWTTVDKDKASPAALSLVIPMLNGFPDAGEPDL